MTLAVWFQRTTSAAQNIFSYDTVSGTQGQWIDGTGSSGLTRVRAFSQAGSGSSSVVDNVEVLNQWTHGLGQFSSNASRTVYANGTAGNTQTTSRGISGHNNLNIGALWTTTLGSYLTGKAAEVALWDVALNTDEIASLSKGFKPFRIRPQSLRYYIPLVRDIQDVRTAVGLTNTNTATVSDHPRVY
jgi:hypothetical protein